MNKLTSKYKSIQRVKKMYGKKGVIRAVYNRLTGRPLEYKLTLKALGKDDIGNIIFSEQQKEMSEEEMRQHLSKMKYLPKISIILPIYNAPLEWLQRAVESIENQIYENWELCAVNDGSTDREGYEYLLKIQKEDDRIILDDMKQNGGISKASNRALEMATGEFVALMDQDDEITPDALFWFADALNQDPTLDFIYSDECKIDGDTGTELSYFICKPDWSPEMLINQMYTGHLTVYRREIVMKVGGFRSQYDFSQDYDLALRISRITQNVQHLERILYFWRSIPTSSAAGGKDYARESNIAALKDHFVAQGITPEMKKFPYANYAYLKMNHLPLVSIIVPSDSCENMERTIKGIETTTDYENYEIILVTNSGAIEQMKSMISNSKVRYCPFDKKYNFSEKCNDGSDLAKGEILIFYNDDVIPRNSDWLDRMLEIFEIEGVGGVAPMLVYENDAIQYAGMISGVRGQVGTSFHMKKYNEIDYWFHQNLLRDVSVLSGACVAVRKNIFNEIGQFNAIHTPSAHSDVDLSYKFLEAGYRCVYTPYACMTHIGNHSWEVKNVKDKSHIYCLKRWGKYISTDPYFTESMKRLFYYTGNYNYYIYVPDKPTHKDNVDCKDILFITHELTRTGAPVQLKNMIMATYKKMGYFPVVVSPTDGPMRQEFLDLGVTVIIDEELLISATNLDNYARNYDLIVVNTMSNICIDAVKELENTLPPILWWIHEGYYAFDLFKKDLPKTLNKRVHLYCASEYSQRILEDFSTEYTSEIIRCGVEDFSDMKYSFDNSEEKQLFLTVGTLEWRKGQQLLLDAIAHLDSEYRQRARFYIIGKCSDEALLKKILECKEKYGCVEYMDTIPREQLMAFYEASVASIIPSRDEPTSLIGIEAMMLSKPIICSDMTGISEFVTDGINGYVFENDNAHALAEKIRLVMDSAEKSQKIGIEARKLYEEKYTMHIFAARCVEVLNSLLD